MSRESARNVSGKLPLRLAARLALATKTLGWTLRTVLDVAGHLLDERLHSWRKVRRRTYQTVLAFDVFMKQLTTTRPDFATFFTNHVASAMHRYWAASFPGDFRELGYPQDWIERFSGEIDFAMSRFDTLLGRLLRFVDANPEYVLWIASSMGQAAADGRPVETQVYLTDPARLMQAAGIASSDWQLQPAMAPRISVFVATEASTRFREFLTTLEVAGKPAAFDERERGFFNLAFGSSNVPPDRQFVRMREERRPFDEVGLSVVDIEDRAGSNGYHVADGILLSYDPLDRKGDASRTVIETTDVAPEILRFFDLEPQEYMSQRRWFSTERVDQNRRLARSAATAAS